MTRQEKTRIIDELGQKLKNIDFYIADIGGLTVAETNRLRRICFNQGVILRSVKNSLLTKALEKTGVPDVIALNELLKGPTSIMITGVPSAPARIIREFRKKHPKPILKGAFIDAMVYTGDEQLAALANLKTKNELIADIILALQSPVYNVINALSSGKMKLAGIIKTLSDKPE